MNGEYIWDLIKGIAGFSILFAFASVQILGKVDYEFIFLATTSAILIIVVIGKLINRK